MRADRFVRLLIGAAGWFWLAAATAFASECKREDCDSLIRAAIEASVRKDYARSQELLVRARQAAEARHDPELMFRIWTNIGINQAELLDMADALGSLTEAHRIATEHLDTRREMSSLNNLAGLYMMDNQPRRALDCYESVRRTINPSTDSLFAGGCALNIATASIALNDYVRASSSLQEAEQYLTPHTSAWHKMNCLKAHTCLNDGQARQAYDLARTSALEVLPSGPSTLLTDLRLAWIRAALTLERTDEAFALACAALAEQPNIDERRTLYRLAAQALFANRQYDLAFAYRDSAEMAADTLRAMQGRKMQENNRIRLEMFKQEKELDDYRRQRRTTHLLFGLCAVLAAVLAWALAGQIVKNRQQRRIAALELSREKERKQRLQAQLEEQTATALLKQQQFQHEIERKGRKLVSDALMLAGRNEKIGEALALLEEADGTPASDETRLKEAVRILRKLMDGGEGWKQFTAYFEQSNDEFINKLHDRHPDLTANEIRFLSLVFINLSTKEISELQNITPEYCKKKKQQIARKLGLQDTKLLYSYLSSL